MIYDGDCCFCTLWIHRWQCATGELVEYLPSQDPQIARRFPEIPRAEFDSSVQLVETDGSVYSGAEAVFKSLAHKEHYHLPLQFYRDFPVFADTSEWLYRFVAGHRTFFSQATKLLWGRHVERPSYLLVRRAFLGCLGIIYFIAFISLWVQITGLMGSNGIVPVESQMAAWKQEASDAHIGLSRFLNQPTLCWLSSSDAFLKFQCAAGALLAVLLVFGIAPALCLFLLWLIYLSLCTVGAPFLNFQWDILLLETGFLAIFLAPWQWLPRHPLRETPPSRVVIWLLRWLLFKLMFQSGCVKLSSDENGVWHNRTALNYHFETQPLPTWIGWYAHQLPHWVHRSDIWMIFAIELAVPFLIFFPRRPRQFACLAFIALQLFIMLTGNYGFFNLLTIVLCIPLLDDAALQKCLPRDWCACSQAIHGLASPFRRAVRGVLLTMLVGAVALTSCVQFFITFEVQPPLPLALIPVYLRLAPFRSFNGYGLFATMTTTRPEIVIEGSYDGKNWLPYEFKYKPGELNQRPQFVEPYQPRLDWQMWFAALGDYRNNPWIVNFCVRLMQGSPQVLSLLDKNPFSKKPPVYLRATAYTYHFTTIAERHKTGNWWKRTPLRIYLPKISLPPDSGGPSGVPAER